NGLELSPAHMWLAAGAASVVAATVAVATRVHQLRQRGRLCCMAFRLRDWGNRTVRRTARLRCDSFSGRRFNQGEAARPSAAQPNFASEIAIASCGQAMRGRAAD